MGLYDRLDKVEKRTLNLRISHQKPPKLKSKQNKNRKENQRKIE